MGSSSIERPAASALAANPIDPSAEILPSSGPRPVYLVDLPRTGLRERAGWWSDRGELVLGGGQGHPMVRKPLMFDGKHSKHGVYISAWTDFEASISYRLGRRFDSFQAEILIPDMFPEQTDPKTPLVFKIVGDGRTIWRSEPMVRKGEHRSCRVAVTGVEELSLKIECLGPSNWGLAAWVEPRLIRGR